MDITDPTEHSVQAQRRLGLYHSCLAAIIEEVNALIKEPFYLCFAVRKVRLCQAFYYNTFFFEYWGERFVKTFGLVCPFYDVQSVKDVEHLLNAKFTRFVDAFGIILHNKH